MDPASLLAAFNALPADEQGTLREYLSAPAPAPMPAPAPKRLPAPTPAAPALHVRCYAHDNVLIGLCKKCDEPVCNACQGCIENHDVVPLAAVVEDVFPTPPSAKDVRMFAAAAQEAIPTALAESKNAIQTMQEAERSVEAHEKFTNRAEIIRAHDKSELTRMRSELAAARDRVDTDAAKAALDDAKEQLEADAGIDAELAQYGVDLLKTHITAALARTAAAQLRGALARLEFVSEIEAFPPDGSGQVALALAVRRLHAGFGWAPSVYEFSAFRNANAMAEVVAALAKPLQSAGLVRVSGAEVVDWLPAVGCEDHPVASLSACGVLCVGGEVEAKVLAVAHLPSRRVAAIRCNKETVHGFVHAGELYVAQVNHAMLWHAPVKSVLAGHTDLAMFAQFSLKARWGKSARLDAAPAGWVAVANNDNWAQHMVVDLTTRTSRLVEVGQRLQHLGGFTGIAVPGVGWATTGFSKTIFVVAPNGSVSTIARDMEPFLTVLPSAAAAADFTRAAVLNWQAVLSVNEVKGRLQGPIMPYCQSLVRLHQDVFLCWDIQQKSWVVARIFVP